MADDNNKKGLEKLLQAAVVLLCFGVIAVLALTVKATFYASSSVPRTSIEKQLYEAQKAIDKDPNDPTGHLMLGYTYHQMGEYDKAEIEYTNILKVDKSNIKATMLLAINFQKQKRANEAIKVLKKLGDYEPALYQIGWLYLNKGDYEQSIHFLKKALKKSPTASDALYQLGKAYEKTNKKSEAIKSYETALKYSPDYNAALKALERLK